MRPDYARYSQPTARQQPCGHAPTSRAHSSFIHRIPILVQPNRSEAKPNRSSVRQEPDLDFRGCIQIRSDRSLLAGGGRGAVPQSSGLHLLTPKGPLELALMERCLIEFNLYLFFLFLV